MIKEKNMLDYLVGCELYNIKFLKQYVAPEFVLILKSTKEYFSLKTQVDVRILNSKETLMRFSDVYRSNNTIDYEENIVTSEIQAILKKYQGVRLLKIQVKKYGDIQ